MRKFVMVSGVAGLVVAAAAMSPANADQATAAATGWRKVATPELPTNGSLNGIAAISKRDAWAVGNQYGTSSKGLILRWNGKKWRVVSAPSQRFLDIVAVAGSSSSNVWVAGTCAGKAAGTRVPCAARWNGKKWGVYDLPGSVWTQTTTITVLSAKDAWIGGENNAVAYFVRWNGKKWSSVSSPKPAAGHSRSIAAISAAGPKDIWALGLDASNTTRQALIEHWDGKRWSVKAAPKLPGETYLASVVALPKKQAWASGRGPRGPVVLRYTGGRWREAPKIGGTSATTAQGLTSDGAGGVWLTVTTQMLKTTPAATHRTTYAHWNGKKWTVSKGGAYTGNPPYTAALARVPGTRSIWSAGYQRATTKTRPTIEIYGPLPQ